jgi:hypothetical protein
MSAAHHQLDNLICLVDINNQQADGPSSKVLGFEPLADKWAAFGWHVQRVDGNDLKAVLAAFDAARNAERGQAARDPVRHPDGQGRAVPGSPRQEPFHPRRPARVAAGARHPRPEPTRRSRRMSTVAEKKPRLTTSAMIASIASEGQRVKAAPFGKALVELRGQPPRNRGHDR